MHPATLKSIGDSAADHGPLMTFTLLMISTESFRKQGQELNG